MTSFNEADHPRAAAGKFAEKTFAAAPEGLLAGPEALGDRTVTLPGKTKRSATVDVTFQENRLIGIETADGYVEISRDVLDKLIVARHEDDDARAAAKIHIGLRVDVAGPGLPPFYGEVVGFKQDRQYAEVRLDDRGRTLSYLTQRLKPVG